MGIIAPAWYFAPQRNQVAEAGWNLLAQASGVFGDQDIGGLEDPDAATFLLQIAGEFAEPEIKKRIWESAEHFIEPNWDEDVGEFTLGLRLNEAYPRGQLNARIMAGWVCGEGAWSRIFNEPNLGKFNEPTIEGVDFPRVALSEAKWDGKELHLAAHAQNASVRGTRTIVRLTNVASVQNWTMTTTNNQSVDLANVGDYVEVPLIVDNQTVVLSQRS